MKDIFVTIGIVLVLIVMFIGYGENERHCKNHGGITVNRGFDCWVEGRGYINAFEE